MKYRRLSADGDYCFGSGLSDYVTDAEAVAQAIKTKLLLLRYEWWEDMTKGLPLFQRILGRRASEENLQAVELIIRERVLEVPNVKAVTGYKASIDRDSRRYSASIEVSTAFGDRATVEIEY